MRPIIWENLSLVPMMMSLFAAVKRSQEAKFAGRAREQIQNEYRQTGLLPIVFSTLVIPELVCILREARALHLDVIQTFVDPLKKELGISPTETDVITARSPVRPVPMGVYGNDTFYPKFLGGGRDE